MTDDKPLRRSGILTFPESPTDEYMLCAILVTQDDEGRVHHYIRTGKGCKPLAPDTAAMFAQAVELAQL